MAKESMKSTISNARGTVEQLWGMLFAEAGKQDKCLITKKKKQNFGIFFKKVTFAVV